MRLVKLAVQADKDEPALADEVESRRANVAGSQNQGLHDRLDMLLETACEGLYEWNVTGGELWLSPRMMEIFDIGQQRLTPQLWLNFVHADDVDGYRDAVRRHFKSDEVKLDVEYRIRSRTGGYRWIRDRSSAVRQADGQVIQVVGAVLDISEQKQREAELARSTWVLENTLQHMTQGIVMVDADLNLAAYNRRCLEILELPDGLLSRYPPMADIFRFQAERGEYGDGPVEEWVAQRFANLSRFEAQRYERTRPNGTVIEVHGQPVADGRGYVMTFTDITKRKLASQWLRSLATTDALTGLANRRQFFRLSGKELSRATRRRLPYSVMYIDIDRFKAINDGLGHAAGDEVLRQVAAIIAQAMRAEDVAGRIGGEEFAVLLPDTPVDKARVVAERLRVAIANCEIEFDDALLRTTVSIGLSGGEHGRQALDEAMSRADQALYRAKSSGRNCVQVV